MFLDDLKAYLTGKGYSDISRDTMPDQPDECIGLFVYATPRPSISDGSCTRFVQIQVRRFDGDDACSVAGEILPQLDSGLDETPVLLAEGRECIIRPTAGVKKLSTDDKGRTTYYFEAAFWGGDEP